MANNIIPKNLPQTDPLLFSILMIIECMDQNVYFNGGSTDAESDMPLPSLSYAVNTWTTGTKQDSRGVEIDVIKHDLLMAIWTEKPEEDCEIEWSHYPSLDQRVTKRTDSMKSKIPFEDWRIESFGILDAVIGCLINKAEKNQRDVNNKRVSYLADIFGWYVEKNSLINYAYIKDSTNNGLYGVGAAFTLCCPKYDCCPVVDKSKLQISYLKGLGFSFDGLM